jgi:hypothetical protein
MFGPLLGGGIEPDVEGGAVMAQMDDPRFRAEKLKQMLREAMERARQDIVELDDVQARALFETTAEVLGGLVNTFEHYEAGTEPAWRRPGTGNVTIPH